MTGTADKVADLHSELTSLAVQLLTLSQDLVTAKLRLETLTKGGWILLAKARYVSHGGVSITQVIINKTNIGHDTVSLTHID